MSNKIFHFTGTGNAYSIAKSLAASLGDADLVPMAKALQSPDIGEAARIGLIFPVYGWGMPRMAAEFARNLKPTSDQYVFAVATSGGTPGKTLPQLHKILRGHGSKLDAGFAVTGDFLISLDTANDMAIITFMNWLGRKSKPAAMSERLPEIARAVAAKESRKPEKLECLSQPHWRHDLRHVHQALPDHGQTFFRQRRLCLVRNLCQSLSSGERHTRSRGAHVASEL